MGFTGGRKISETEHMFNAEGFWVFHSSPLKTPETFIITWITVKA
jgi:hypothetical protein